MNGRTVFPSGATTFTSAIPEQQDREKEMKEAGVTTDITREDESSDDEKMTTSNDRQHSRQELKQLDREIPRRQLTELPKAQYEEYLQAVRTENDSWMTWGGIQPIPTKEAKRILADHKLAKRILKARAACKDKSKGVGPLRPKCRVVLIGCQDPDVFKLSRDIPTATRLSESLLMAIAAAGANWGSWLHQEALETLGLQRQEHLLVRRTRYVGAQRAALCAASERSSDRGYLQFSRRTLPGHRKLLWTPENSTRVVQARPPNFGEQRLYPTRL